MRSVVSAAEQSLQLTAREAFSNGDNKPDRGSYPCHQGPCPKTIVVTNSVLFPSVYYDDRKSMVGVTW